MIKLTAIKPLRNQFAVCKISIAVHEERLSVCSGAQTLGEELKS